ncbi:MAG: glycosyltransferase family 4 protein [Anaerolineales bacterium]|nr:glycosyltransferase family 4 protein [Anaerolineales bacterium]
MKTAILHYSTAPVIGGVESVIQAHAEQFADAGLDLTVIAGRGEASAMPRGVDFIGIDEIDTLHPQISAATDRLNSGEIPDTFDGLVKSLAARLRPLFAEYDHIIVHNVLTKHFNLPLTTALFHLMDEGLIKHPIAWCHDLTWSSPSSRDKVYPAYPWELLKKYRPDVTYVAVSEQRQKEVIETFGCLPEQVHIVYNGVNPVTLFGLSIEGAALMNRLDLLSADLIFLMPVRVTKAKNIEFALELVAAIKKLNCRPKLVLTGPPDPHDPDSMAYYQSLLELRRRLGVENEMRFVYESGLHPDAGYFIGDNIVSELYRVADAMLMPSHREGFGMPVLEAGLLGLPVISTPMPALRELAQENALTISNKANPDSLARQILNWLGNKPEHALRVKARQSYTWKSIFKRQILPLLKVKDR